jgi:hypothetical protein
MIFPSWEVREVGEVDAGADHLEAPPSRASFAAPNPPGSGNAAALGGCGECPGLHDRDDILELALSEHRALLT